MFIVNPHGILHSIPDGWPLPKGARPATAAEVATWEKEDAEQRRLALSDKRKKAADRAQLVVMHTPTDTPVSAMGAETGGKDEPEPEPRPEGTRDGKEKKADGK